MGVPLSQVFGVATFYSQFSLTPKGEHTVSVCLGTACYVKGADKILKKIGEESTEVIIAAKDHDKANTIYEIGDLMYHVMVLMIEEGITLEDIRREMAGRHVIDHKVKQEKMR